MTTPKHPGGRPALPPEQRLVILSIRLSREQRDKLARLGGAQWIRDKIDHARAFTDEQIAAAVKKAKEPKE